MLRSRWLQPATRHRRRGRVAPGGVAHKPWRVEAVEHFVEVGVDAATGETRVRRMLAVCAAGRILNPMTARSQVIGGMTMGVGAALTEELAVNTRLGLFVNPDLAGCEVPVHADTPHQDVMFLDETDPMSSPMKAKGVGDAWHLRHRRRGGHCHLQRDGRAGA